jgi:hypothetical protein
MVYSFARIGAAIGMRVEDVYSQYRRDAGARRTDGEPRQQADDAAL